MPPRLVSDMTAAELEEYLEWLEMMKPMPMAVQQTGDGIYGACGRCGHRLVELFGQSGPSFNYDEWPKYCPACGQRAKRCEGDV